MSPFALRINFSGEGPDGIGGREEFSATAVLKPDGTLVGALTSTTSGNLDVESRSDGRPIADGRSSSETSVKSTPCDDAPVPDRQSLPLLMQAIATHATEQISMFFAALARSGDSWTT